MATEKITIYDIADKLDISVSTVSRVLNNSQLVSDDKTRLIRETAEQMGYQKRSIKRHRKRTILNIVLILPYRDDTYMHLFYDAAQLIKGIEDGFGDIRISINTDLDRGECKIFSHKKNGNIDGVIFAFSDPREELLDMLEERQIPYVFLNRIKEHNNFICCDNMAGMMTLVSYLKNTRKAKNIVFIIDKRVTGVNETRECGFRDACRENNINGRVVSISSITEITPGFIKSLKPETMDAVMCSNDVLATTVYQALMHEGFRIPDDIALTGFDNSPLRELFWDKLTTIDMSVGRLGKEAAVWLKKTIVYKEESVIQKLIQGDFIPGTTA